VNDIVDTEEMRAARKEAALADLTAMATSSWGLAQTEMEQHGSENSREDYLVEFRALLNERMEAIALGGLAPYTFRDLAVVWTDGKLDILFDYIRYGTKDQVRIQLEVEPKSWWK